MAYSCPVHATENNRSHLVEIIRTLPHSQAGDGRHRCAYCAYERGRIAAFLGVSVEELTLLDHQG